MLDKQQTNAAANQFVLQSIVLIAGVIWVQTPNLWISFLQDEQKVSFLFAPSKTELWALYRKWDFELALFFQSDFCLIYCLVNFSLATF